MINRIRFLLKVTALKLALVSKGTNRVIAFDLASLGEFQFFRSVLFAFAKRNPKDQILIIHHGETIDAFEKQAFHIKDRLLHTTDEIVRSISFAKIDLFLTTEQYDHGLDGVYSVILFHGQPSKGLTFTTEIVNSFDALFLYGPLHRQAFYQFAEDFPSNPPVNIDLFEIGYPKSDALLNGSYAECETINILGLNPTRKTILYAPAFNEGASLREYGLEIIELLASQTDYNIIVKLPIDCWAPTNNFYATGGINWFDKIRELESQYPTLCIYSDYQVDPLLACSDVLITCISSVSFEFLALNRPVIFIDTPKYFSGYLRQFFPDRDTVSWANRTTVNGGKEFGLVISDIRDLPQAIHTVLSNPQEYPHQQERLKSYLLYNSGRGADVAVSKIEELLACKAQTKRPRKQHGLVYSVAYKLINIVADAVSDYIAKLLNARGYTFQKTGLGYIDPKVTVQNARAANLTICDYLESCEADTRKHGRRNRIIAQMEKRHLFESCNVILEIGAGTGMYLEKVIDKSLPNRYEVYETHQGWIKYLKSRYINKESCELIFHSADGETLKETVSESCQLVHSHAVFVYIPALNTFSYLREAARVLASGGYLVFDCILESNFGTQETLSWLSGQWRFPVILHKEHVLDFLNRLGLVLVGEFREIYGLSSVDYLVFQKQNCIL
jgi:CDP-glycerol glycerophosphotransferase (TagB/SpsB family)/ubiquinone/menaquinone biosynthesis C-methylase UbiE